MPLLDAYGVPIPKDIRLEKGHFASRTKQNNFLNLLKVLPDPDPILRKKGKDITALKELLTDSHLEANLSVRFSAVSGCEFNIVTATNNGDDIKACDFMTEVFSSIENSEKIEEMMEAVSYGYKPVELIWGKDTSHWYLSDIVGKPPEWFAFDADNQLVLKTKNCDFEKLPPNKFILLTHRSSYENPYGQKALSKCFWPVVFKRSGFQWWTTFVEKYGGAFAFGTYPLAFEKMKDDLLEMLSKIISDGVAAIPEGSNVEIIEATGKAGSSLVFKDYIEMANEEISKSILGQTLTTETSKHGNLATATVHNIVREDLVVSDKKRIAGAYNKIFAILTHFNFSDAKPPRFEFFEEEDVKKEKADRDKVIFDMGFRFSEEYLVREYGYQEGDLKEEAPDENPETNDKEFFKYFQKSLKNRFPDKPSVFDRILSFFKILKHSPEEKKMIRDQKIIDQYKKSRAPDLQNEVDKMIDRLLASMDQGKSLESVRELIIKEYPKLDFSEINRIIAGVRYVSSQTGAYSEGVKSKKKTSR